MGELQKRDEPMQKDPNRHLKEDETVWWMVAKRLAANKNTRDPHKGPTWDTSQQSYATHSIHRVCGMILLRYGSAKVLLQISLVKHSLWTHTTPGQQHSMKMRLRLLLMGWERSSQSSSLITIIIVINGKILPSECQVDGGGDDAGEIHHYVQIGLLEGKEVRWWPSKTSRGDDVLWTWGG